MNIDRRIVLKAGAAWLLTSAASLPGEELAVPTVDGLELTVLVDSTTAVFGGVVTRPGFRSLPPPITRDYHTAFAGQWGYSLLARSTIGGTARCTLVDFGYTPEALLNNMALLGVDPVTIDAAVLSHGHYDHFGGLDGLLATGKVRRGVPLFVGGEEAFCARVRGIEPDGPPFGALDRPAIQAAGIDLQVSPEPAIIASHGFTTGRIPLSSPERPRVPTGMLPGQGCSLPLLDMEKRGATFIVDDAVHELGTAFNLRDKGLVVIGSCSHRGIINTVLRAKAVSGIDRVHAVVGGFHLVPPQTLGQALETASLMQALNPDYIIPGHCSGETFIAAAQAAMPGKVLRSIVGTRYQFGAAVA
jgi:7,8-dihydropterin-6-yl-methyl-4-(beta-D-ribofuranosyl)aminobenzene 5'-phosphate synthase